MEHMGMLSEEQARQHLLWNEVEDFFRCDASKGECDFVVESFRESPQWWCRWGRVVPRVCKGTRETRAQAQARRGGTGCAPGATLTHVEACRKSPPVGGMQSC